MRNFLFVSLLASMWMPSSLLAQTPDNRTQISIALGTLKYDAKERSTSGAVINHESGSLPFVQLGARHAFTPAYFVDASWRYAGNTINYAGFTQLGIPLNTQTKLAWHQMSLSAGYRYAFSEAHSLEATLGLGQRGLDRAIQASLGSLPLREVLSTTQLQLGAKWQHRLSAHSQWHAGIELYQALRQSLAVDSYGLYDPITLRPAKQLDTRLHAGASYAFSPQWRIAANVGLDRIKPGASSTEIWRKNGVPAAGVRYPGSTQRALDYGLVLSTHF